MSTATFPTVGGGYVCEARTSSIATRSVVDRWTERSSSRSRQAIDLWARTADKFAGHDPRLLRVIRDYPGFAWLLAQIPERIAEHFPEQHILTIEQSHIGQAPDDDWYVVIHADISPDLALQQLDRFDKEWWLGAKPDIHPELVVTVQLA